MTKAQVSWTIAWPAVALTLFCVMLVNVRSAKGESPSGLDESEAHAHLQAGLTLYRAGRFDDALAEFEAAFRRVQSPNLRFNIGLCLHRLGRINEASTVFAEVAADPTANPEVRAGASKQIAWLATLPKEGSVPSGISMATAPDNKDRQIKARPTLVAPGPIDVPRPDDPRPRRRSIWLWWVAGAAMVAAAGLAGVWVVRRDTCGADLCRDVHVNSN